MARGIWKGTLGFGLVNIGVELFSGGQISPIDLDMLDKRDLSRIGYQTINKSTGEVVERKDIVKGMEVAKNRYVVLSAKDLEAASPKGTQTIEIEGFVERDAIELVHFDRLYFVLPLKGSERAYALLRDALADTAKLGLAHLVIRTRKYVAAVYPHGGALVVHTLRYREEMRDPAELGPAKLSARGAAPKEIGMAKQLIESMSMEFEPEGYTDSYRKELLALVKSRARSGGKKSPPLATAPEAETRTTDLLEALRESMAQGRRRGRPSSGRPRKGPRPATRRSGR